MIVPRYWAEAKIQTKHLGKHFTVRRFGWSSDSLADAQKHAEKRTEEALQRILSGEKLLRSDPKIGYGGAHGLPIREEIIEEFADNIVTRNSYGARCLNSPDVLIADIDFREAAPESCLLITIGFFAAFPISAFGLLALQIPENLFNWLLAPCIVATFVIIIRALHWLRDLPTRLRGGHETIARNRVDRFMRKHPDWHLRRYRTPNGLRLIAMHQVFDARSAMTTAAFQALEVDQTYAVMCQKQNCFRARLTAKPWRIGILSHMKPRPGTWPINPDRMAERLEWINDYEAKAINYAACRFEESMGATHQVHPRSQQLCDYHDKACQANDNLEIA